MKDPIMPYQDAVLGLFSDEDLNKAGPVFMAKGRQGGSKLKIDWDLNRSYFHPDGTFVRQLSTGLLFQIVEFKLEFGEAAVGYIVRNAKDPETGKEYFVPAQDLVRVAPLEALGEQAE
jgi:hypothetical protein